MSVDTRLRERLGFYSTRVIGGEQMAKNEQRGAKDGKKLRFLWQEKDLFCGDSILLRGSHSAVFYGCEKILFYGKERICFSMARRSVSVFGSALCCTVFSPVGVTVEGNIAGVCYCDPACKGRCSHVLKEEELG
jgi:hypothetical protein